MQIFFQLNLETVWGDTVIVQLIDNNENTLQYEMNCMAPDKWGYTMKLNHNVQYISYSYQIRHQNGLVKNEFGKKRTLAFPLNLQKVHVVDTWSDPNVATPFATKAFTNCFLKRKKAKPNKTDINANLVLKLRCPQIEPDRHFAIIGNQECLGNWDETKNLRMDETDFPIWSIALDGNKIEFPLEYKYVIVETKTNKVLQWGDGDNRKLEKVDENSLTIVTDENFERTIPHWKTAGVAMPVFSLRSEGSFGTGDFMDLKLMVEWAKKTNQHIIQTLPINDTILHHSNYDSYPYNAVSVYALHPIYLRLEKIGELKDKKQAKYFREMKVLLNKNKFSDYQRVLDEKWKYFELIFKQEQTAIFASNGYKRFFKKNSSWLVPYAVFSYLRDENGTPAFKSWKQYSTYDKEEIEQLANPGSEHYDKIAMFYFLQYHLHEQLIEVRKYAHKRGVALKSDIPIGVSPMSVDAWVEPELFNTNMQAGAPPDDFSVTGQNWGFPTYNWELMAKDKYEWWTKRFTKFQEYFDAYRIDHILGFFRIWEIPADAVWALTGSFYPSLPFAVKELENRGVWWDTDRYLKPYLKEHVIRAVFGKYADDVMREYLQTDGWQNFKFKPEFDTQKKIEAHFSALGYNFTTKEVAIRDGLYALHCEVLFVPDKRDSERFHPRISMHSSHTFKDLPEDVRRVLDTIYIDYYYHRHNEFWKQKALEKLPALVYATDMLACGEDLGMVPDSVPDVMSELELISLEIQRMPKKTNTEFAMPADAPYLSVCTTSTHDMNPIRAWWKEDKGVTQRFFNRALKIEGPAPEELSPVLAEKIVEQHLQSTAMLVILPWQDWMAMDGKLRRKDPDSERINIPSDPRNFWCYRMHLTLEQLLEEKIFNNKIKNMIQQAGR